VLDAAQSELDAAQQAYNKMLSSSAATDVKEARARLAVAQARLDNANDAYNLLLTGDNSLQVQVAQTSVDQAKTAVTQAQVQLAQAQAGLAQAQAAVKVLDVQIAKTTVISPVAGTVLSRPANPGEITAAGATVVEIGSLDEVKLTVYIPEDLYGKVKLGQDVKISVDSFTGRTFTGSVTLISNQAEFTPRNVQTVESRSTTVYAVEITIQNQQHDLKDGMPADATF
jgi:HlyD family secretion protein